MKRSSLLVAAVAAAVLFSFSPADAQFTITIPKLPKIKKDRPATATPTATTETTTETTTDTTRSTSTTTTESTETASSGDSGGAAANEYFPASITNDDYTGLALSTTDRAKWLKDHKTGPNAKLDAAFEGLKASIVKRLPEHKAAPKSFAFHNVAEEKMMLGELRNIVGLKVFKSGLSEGSWLIDKNEYGLPTARYKHGAIYGRNPNAEDQFCRVWFVNIVQDYSGGGTYGASGTRYVGKSYVACPAGM
jgi:hypothetical protein